MKKRTAWVLATAVAAVAIGAAAVGAVALVLRGGRPPIRFSGSSYLAMDLDGALPEEPPSGLGGLFEPREPSLRGLVESVDRAAGDPRLKGLVLRVGALDAGWGRVQELRDALARFRRSGKPSWAHLEFAGNKEYYLATACRRIAVAPTALLDISGLAAEVTFYKGTLDKLGVQAQFEGVGRYKTAPNQFTETGFTGPHREQMEALVDSLFGQYVSAIAESRGLSQEEVRARIDQGPFDAAGAKRAGLVDEMLYRDEVEARLKAAARVTPGPYLKAVRGFGFDGRPKLALLYALGDIIPGESQSSPFGGEGLVGADTLVRALRQAARDEDIRAVVLRIDSPGGSGTASDAVWREIALTRRAKPVVVSMGDYAASGGYYIAMNGDAIVAQPGTVTGSIGVFSGKFCLRGLYDKLGLSQETVRRGRNATLFSSYEPWTEEERKKVRTLNAAFYETFVRKAAEGRRKKREEIEAVAQGRVWTGAEALGVGLVDRLGGLDVAVALAREKARIPKGKEVRLVVLPEKKSLFDILLEHREEDVVARGLPPSARSFLRWATMIADRGPIARLPFELSIR